MTGQTDPSTDHHPKENGTADPQSPDRNRIQSWGDFKRPDDVLALVPTVEERAFNRRPVTINPSADKIGRANHMQSADIAEND